MFTVNLVGKSVCWGSADKNLRHSSSSCVSCRTIILYLLLGFQFPNVCVWSLSHVWFFAAPWTVVYQTPLSMGFSRQEYWNGLPFPTPGDLPDSETEPESPGFAGRFLTTSTTWEAIFPGVHANPLQYSCLVRPHRQRSLRAYSPRAHKESDTNELLSTAQLQITSSSG